MCPFPRIRTRLRGTRPAGGSGGLGSLAASLGALLALAAPARAQVYFTTFFAEGGTGVERAGLDGSGLQSLQFEPIGFADGIALDVAAGKMYWTETSAGAIWRANLNGSEAQTILIDSGREPLGIALDLAHEQLYFTDVEGVKRAHMDGAGVELLTKEAARGFIALDLATQQMFWADWPSGTIRSAPIASPALVTTIVKGQPCPFGVALDETNGNLYWLGLEIKEKPKCEKSAAIVRARLDGSAIATILKRPGAGFEGGLAVDPALGRLYWTEAEGHDIRSASLSGGGEGVLLGTGGDFPVGLAVDSADPHPQNTTAPAIEGIPMVGAPLYCTAGSWTGIGPISFVYQWATAGGNPIEGATSSVFVPPAELAGAAARCVVTAADAVETASAASPAVAIAPYAASAPAPQLVAAIAMTRMLAHGSRFAVPVFSSLAGVATLEAIPQPSTHRSRAQAQRHPIRSRRRARRRSAPGTIVVRRSLRAGRNAIVLTRLQPGLLYVLRLTVTSAEGQSAKSSSALRVAHG
jgi:low density lipoprotein receptor-related protein 5/6